MTQVVKVNIAKVTKKDESGEHEYLVADYTDNPLNPDNVLHFSTFDGMLNYLNSFEQPVLLSVDVDSFVVHGD